jgi:hypothetical protein
MRRSRDYGASLRRRRCAVVAYFSGASAPPLRSSATPVRRLCVLRRRRCAAFALPGAACASPLRSVAAPVRHLCVAERRPGAAPACCGAVGADSALLRRCLCTAPRSRATRVRRRRTYYVLLQRPTPRGTAESGKAAARRDEPPIPRHSVTNRRSDPSRDPHRVKQSQARSDPHQFYVRSAHHRSADPYRIDHDATGSRGANTRRKGRYCSTTLLIPCA